MNKPKEPVSDVQGYRWYELPSGFWSRKDQQGEFCESVPFDLIELREDDPDWSVDW